MKYTLFVLASLFICAQASGQSVQWSPAMVVADGTSYDNVYPRLALTTDNTPLVIWENNTGFVYAARWNGSGFTTPVTINPAGISPYIATWVGAEVAASGDTVYIVYSTDIMPPTAVYCQRSIDGGLTFGDTVRVDNVLPENARFPGVAIDSDNNPVVHFMRVGLAEENPRYVISTSANGGMSFGPAVEAASGITGEACDCCPAATITSGAEHVLLFRNNHTDEREMWACFSHDGSQTYTESAAVDTTGWMVGSCPSSGPSAMISGDSLVTTWMTTSKIYVSSINTSTHEIGTHRQLFPTGAGTQNFPVIAGSGDTLAIAWQGTVSGSSVIFFTLSTTGAAGLGANIDTITVLDPGSQTRPGLAFADGTFHLTYADSDGNNVKYMTGILNGENVLSESTVEEPELFLVSNGTQQIIRIQNLNVNTELTVCDETGKIVMNKTLSIAGTQDIPFSAAGPGVYFLKLAVGKSNATKVIIN